MRPADYHHGSQLPWWRGVGCRYTHINRLICRQSCHKQADTAGRQGVDWSLLSRCMSTCHHTRRAHCICALQDAVHIARRHDGSYCACTCCCGPACRCSCADQAQQQTRRRSVPMSSITLSSMRWSLEGEWLSRQLQTWQCSWYTTTK